MWAEGNILVMDMPRRWKMKQKPGMYSKLQVLMARFLGVGSQSNCTVSAAVWLGQPAVGYGYRFKKRSEGIMSPKLQAACEFKGKADMRHWDNIRGIYPQ